MKDRDLLVILGVVLVALFLSSFGAGGMMFGWMFMWLPIVVLIILLAALLGKGSTCMPQHEESAIETLNKRYAKGEISREEYLRMKGEIGK